MCKYVWTHVIVAILIENIYLIQVKPLLVVVYVSFRAYAKSIYMLFTTFMDGVRI